MNDSGDLAAWIELSLVSGLGGQRFRSLLSTFGLPTNVLNATRSQLCRVVPDALAAGILKRDSGSEVEKALQWAAQPEHKVLTLADTEYPKQLLEIADPPALLYVGGNAKLLSSRALAVVGSRNATPQGLKNAQSFARAFSEAGLVIVSGLAIGVDSAAHRGGLEGRGSTIAVLGTGIDIVYPRRNEPLAEEILSRGALVSEFPLGTPPSAGNFPRRNRLISGLSRGCLVVEAALDSGSLITARLAAEQGRDVFAIPGSIHSPLSRGCHALLKDGAKLVESAQDVLEELGVAVTPETRSGEPGSGHDLLDKMGFDPCDIDALIVRSGLTAEIVSAILLQLELEGKIAGLPGGLYQRVR
jgi:DNA processing protein